MKVNENRGLIEESGSNMTKILKVKIYSLAFGGRGVGKIDGKVCFVKGALPDEEVTFRVTKDTSRYTEGEVLEVKVPSSDRQKPVCRYYSICGGCDLQHISYEKELFHKNEQVNQLIRRISGVKDFTADVIVPSKDCYHYRSSVTLHRKGGGYGYYEKGKHSIIPIDECPIAEKSINMELGKIRGEKGKNDITLKTDFQEKVWSSNVMGERFFIDKYDDTELFMSPKAFSQANRDTVVRVIKILKEWIGSNEEAASLFDLYCGTGLFSFSLKDSFCSVSGIDSNRIAINCAKNTVKRGNIRNVKFYKGDAEKLFFDVFQRNKTSRNILFVDPPRMGLAKSFLEKAARVNDIDRIYYLSCDPASFARDVKVLTNCRSWSLNKVLPFDMFPRTAHIEVLAEFTPPKTNS
ncbi:MAG: class I SAM-dependent RNA methyltransferase [Candidatus Omnitrophica bacterium]|nr:class I SAM-dependent RNA methyltransferase [Candidatus Omnitrophota bacterium]